MSLSQAPRFTSETPRTTRHEKETHDAHVEGLPGLKQRRVTLRGSPSNRDIARNHSGRQPCCKHDEGLPGLRLPIVSRKNIGLERTSTSSVAPQGTMQRRLHMLRHFRD